MIDPVYIDYFHNIFMKFRGGKAKWRRSGEKWRRAKCRHFSVNAVRWLRGCVDSGHVEWIPGRLVGWSVDVVHSPDLVIIDSWNFIDCICWWWMYRSGCCQTHCFSSRTPTTRTDTDTDTDTPQPLAHTPRHKHNIPPSKYNL